MAQESRGREKKRKNKCPPKPKSELCFLHVPPQHGEDIETNLMMPQNGILSCRNQSHALLKDDRVVDALMHAEHVPAFF
jgi:hypothetical protein